MGHAGEKLDDGLSRKVSIVVQITNIMQSQSRQVFSIVLQILDKALKTGCLVFIVKDRRSGFTLGDGSQFVGAVEL